MLLPNVDPTTPPRVLVLGDLMLDRYLWGSCDRVSPEAPVQVVNVKRETETLGGAGNVVANVAALGGVVTLVSVAGADVGQTPLPALLRSFGVTTDGLVLEAGRPTTVKTRVIATPQQIVRFDRETTAEISASTAEQLLARFEQALATCDVVALSDYGKGVLTPAVCKAAIAMCRERKKPVLVDPKGTDYSKYRGATLLTPNRREAGAATGVPMNTLDAVTRAGNHLLKDLALQACLITLSEDGMALFDGAREHRLSTTAREVYDVTGAGDTVVAAVAVGLGAGLSLLDSCIFANAAAGIVVGKLGAATATIAEIRAATAVPEVALEAKVVTLDALKTRLEPLRQRGKRIVFTNGCFDILHAGHVRYLAQAKSLGDVLIVGLNSDRSVRQLKGESRPVNHEQDRAALLAGLGAIDYVVIFDEETPLELIRALTPNVLVKGGDYRVEDVVGASEVKNAGGVVKLLPFLEGRSTSALIDRINRGKT